MAFNATCPSCAANLRVEERLIGQTRKCPKCGERFQIQKQPEASEADFPFLSDQAIPEFRPFSKSSQQPFILRITKLLNENRKLTIAVAFVLVLGLGLSLFWRPTKETSIDKSALLTQNEGSEDSDIEKVDPQPAIPVAVANAEPKQQEPEKKPKEPVKKPEPRKVWQPSLDVPKDSSTELQALLIKATSDEFALYDLKQITIKSRFGNAPGFMNAQDLDFMAIHGLTYDFNNSTFAGFAFVQAGVVRFLGRTELVAPAIGISFQVAVNADDARKYKSWLERNRLILDLEYNVTGLTKRRFSSSDGTIECPTFTVEVVKFSFSEAQ